MKRGPLLLALLGLVMLAPPAAGQAFLQPGDLTIDVEPGSEEVHAFAIRNAVNATMAGFARVEGGLGAIAEVEPREFTVPPTGHQELSLLVAPAEDQQRRYHGQVDILLVNPETGSMQRLSTNVTVHVPAPLLLFGVWESPLPGPLSGPSGTFLLEASIWLLGAFVLIEVVTRTGRRLLPKRQDGARKELAGKFRLPLVILITVAGVRRAWRFFPDKGFYSFVEGLLGAVLLLAWAFLVYRAVDAILVYYKRTMATRTESKWDDVIIPAARKIVLALLAAFVFVYILQGFGFDLGFLVAGGLVVGLVLSTALAPTLQNLFSGLSIIVDRPFVEGDDIRLDTGEVTRVERIGLRSTRLYFYRNHELIIVPNSDLENTRVVNLVYPDRRYRMHVVVGVAYGSPRREVERVLRQVALAHPEVVVREPEDIAVIFDDFAESALVYRLVVYVSNVSERFRIAGELRDQIDQRFRDEGITIPFPQRTVWLNDGPGHRTEPDTREGPGNGAGP